MRMITKCAALLALSTLAGAAQAAHVECMVSGTPTQQQYTAHHCSSQVNSSYPGVAFRFVANKPVASVTWSHNGFPSQGQWSCTGDTFCMGNFPRYHSGSMNEATACVTQVLYKDQTWESLNVCATGTFYGGPGIPEY